MFLKDLIVRLLVDDLQTIKFDINLGKILANLKGRFPLILLTEQFLAEKQLIILISSTNQVREIY